MASGRLSKVKGKVLDIPTVPTIGTATAGGELATVAFTASTKGGPVSTYTALSNPGSVTGSGTSSPVTVSGLTAGTAYTFTVRGNNVTGSSEYSSASNSITPTAATSYESISTTTVGAGGSSQIDFTSIPSSYTHLQIRAFYKTGTQYDNLGLTLNSDTGNNYAQHQVGGYGTVFAGATTSTSNPNLLITTSAASTFAVGIIDILDYANTNKYKTMRSLNGADENSSGYIILRSALWQNTNAITSISISKSGQTISQYSHFALYGIKGS